MFSQEEKKLASAPSILKQIEETMNLLESKYGFSGTAKFYMYKDSQFSEEVFLEPDSMKLTDELSELDICKSGFTYFL